MLLRCLCGELISLRVHDLTTATKNRHAESNGQLLCLSCWQSLKDLDSYVSVLNDIAHLEVKGVGKARFIYATTKTRGVEIYESDSCGMIVEYYCSESEISEKEKEFFDKQKLTQSVLAWLNDSSTY